MQTEFSDGFFAGVLRVKRIREQHASKIHNMNILLKSGIKDMHMLK